MFGILLIDDDSRVISQVPGRIRLRFGGAETQVLRVEVRTKGYIQRRRSSISADIKNHRYDRCIYVDDGGDGIVKSYDSDKEYEFFSDGDGIMCIFTVLHDATVTGDEYTERIIKSKLIECVDVAIVDLNLRGREGNTQGRNIIAWIKRAAYERRKDVYKVLYSGWGDLERVIKDNIDGFDIADDGIVKSTGDISRFERKLFSIIERQFRIKTFRFTERLYQLFTQTGLDLLLHGHATADAIKDAKDKIDELIADYPDHQSISDRLIRLLADYQEDKSWKEEVEKWFRPDVYPLVYREQVLSSIVDMNEIDEEAGKALGELLQDANLTLDKDEDYPPETMEIPARQGLPLTVRFGKFYAEKRKYVYADYLSIALEIFATNAYNRGGADKIEVLMKEKEDTGQTLDVIFVDNGQGFARSDFQGVFVYPTFDSDKPDLNWIAATFKELCKFYIETIKNGKFSSWDVYARDYEIDNNFNGGVF